VPEEVCALIVGYITVRGIGTLPIIEVDNQLLVFRIVFEERKIIQECFVSDHRR
jgi:hypothetical protein